MSESPLNRRDFTRLAVAAFGGLVAGANAGCGSKNPPDTTAAPAAGSAGDGSTEVAAKEVHLCRGLNSCKGKGASGTNECAGRGDCATARHHECGGENDCKGLGGCGDTAGRNECKGQGGCHVPLMEHAWESVREQFEAKMKAAGKPFGDPPPPKS